MSKIVNERTLNPNLKTYIFRLVSKKISGNSLFTKVFGKNFAKSRAKKYIEKVYTNEPESTAGCEGYHKSDDKSITICSASKDGSLLKIKDVEEDKDLQGTALHEAIHAILEHTHEECKQIGIESGTGLLEYRYDKNSGSWTENGRGINEGFTNWVCELSGLNMYSYKELKRFIRLLEVAVGPEKVLEMGKGGLFNRIPSLLGITVEDFKELVATSDSLYFIRKELSTDKNIVDVLTSCAKENTTENKKKYEEASEEIEEIRRKTEFIRYINDNNLDSSDESILKFLKDQVNELERRNQLVIIDFESKVLDLYFTKDFEKILKKEGLIDEEDYEKVLKVMKNLNTIELNVFEQIQNLKPKPTVLRIQEEFKDFQKKYIKQCATELAREFKEGRWSLKYISNTGYLKFNFNNMLESFFREFAEQVDSDISNIIFNLAKYVNDNWKNPEKFANSKIYKLVSKDGTISSALLFNNGTYSDKYLYEFKNVDKNSNKVDFDFTLNPGEEGKKEYDSAVQKFLELRQKILSKNPNSEIYIASNNIIVKDGKNTLYYHIHKGEIIPMFVKKEIDTNIIKRNLSLITIIQYEKSYLEKLGKKFSNIINGIKNRLFTVFGTHSEGESDASQKADTTKEQTTSNSSGFEKRIKLSNTLISPSKTSNRRKIGTND